MACQLGLLKLSENNVYMYYICSFLSQITEVYSVFKSVRY